MVDEDSELISIYYGEDMSEEDAESLAKNRAGISGLRCGSKLWRTAIYYCVVSVE